MSDLWAEKVNPYGNDGRQKGEQVREMFDNIAPAYDFMNRAMTLGIDKIWRRKAIAMIHNDLKNRGVNAPSILDVATGTGDLAILLAQKVKGSTVYGIDLSEAMIEVGRKKILEKKLTERILLDKGDCLALTMNENTFDCVSVAYGVRNFQRLADGYKEMLRVLKPGGMLCVVELSTPTSKIVKPFYDIYTKHVIPTVGRMVSHDVRAYSYLPESIAAVPQGEEMKELLSETGFIDSDYHPMTFGVCTIYTAHKAI